MTTDRSMDIALVQRALDQLVADGAPGALAELRNSEGCWPLAAGVADIHTSLPAQASSRVRIGSVTKSFTATLVFQLIGAGRLNLEDTVEDWLPGLVPNGQAISVLHLLDHRSGLYNNTDGFDQASILRDRSTQRPPRDAVAQAVSQPTVFAPGTSRKYCNTGYLLLGLIIAEASGCPYDELLASRILGPLGLNDTTAGTTDAMAEPHLHGYLPVGDELVDLSSYNSSQAWAAGGMVSTANDLNRFYAALLGGDLLGDRALIRTTSPTADPDVDAGLGMFRVRLPGGRTVWGKDGGFFGYHTWSFHTERAERQLTVSMSVARNARPASRQFLGAVADVFA